MIIEYFNVRAFQMFQMPLMSRKSRLSFVPFNEFVWSEISLIDALLL